MKPITDRLYTPATLAAAVKRVPPLPNETVWDWQRRCEAEK